MEAEAPASGGGEPVPPGWGAVSPTFDSPGWGPGLGQDLDEGDRVVLSSGRERYEVVPGNPGSGFEVGPVSVSVKLRSGEGVRDLFMRGHRVLDAAFEAEFALKRMQFWDRLGEAGQRPAGRRAGGG